MNNFVIEGPRVLDTWQLRRLLSAPDRRTRKGRRDAALLAVLGCGGLRIGECATLRLANLEEGHHGLLRIRLKSLKRRNHWRVVTLPTAAATRVRAWAAEVSRNGREWLFPGNSGQPLSTRAVEKTVHRYFAQLGLTRLRPHSLRHTALSLLMRETSDVFRVQRMAGHASVNTTTEYYLAWSVREADESAVVFGTALKHARNSFRVMDSFSADATTRPNGRKRLS